MEHKTQPAIAATAPVGHNTLSGLDVARIREDFPILSRQVHGQKLVFLDSGASAQKPRQVIDVMRELFEDCYANVHRGVHYLSQQTTERYEAVREDAARLLNAPDPQTIVYTKGATEAINLVAQSYGRTHLKAGDEIIISAMEHHANIVPWQMLREELGIVLKVIPVDEVGHFLFDEFEKLLSPRTKLVAITHVSNVLGTVLPIAEITARAHAAGALVLVDGCQAIPHMAVDVTALDADFYAFSGHKLYGPTGVGILYGKPELLEAMPPWQGGGDMIEHVSFERTTFKPPPLRFEAGTPAIAEIIGLGEAIRYVEAIGLDAIEAYEESLTAYAHERLATVPGLRILGQAPGKTSIISFVMEDVHAHDVGTIIDRKGVAVRVGHHCAEPLMHRYGVSATIRASLGVYNTAEEIDALVDALNYAREFFA